MLKNSTISMLSVGTSAAPVGLLVGQVCISLSIIFFSCLIFNHILRSAYYSCPEVGRSRCVAGSDVHHLQPAQPLNFVSVGSKHFVVYHSHFILLVHSPPFSFSSFAVPHSPSLLLLLVHFLPLLVQSPPFSFFSFTLPHSPSCLLLPRCHHSLFSPSPTQDLHYAGLHSYCGLQDLPH